MKQLNIILNFLLSGIFVCVFLPLSNHFVIFVDLRTENICIFGDNVTKYLLPCFISNLVICMLLCGG